MNKQRVVLVNGMPATGKTTIGKSIAQELAVPFICKDDIKELLFDNVGVGDREWSRKIGSVSFVLMYYVIEKLLQSGQSFVVETNFDNKFADPKWRELIEKFDFELHQVFCRTSSEIRKQRFIQRNEQGERHSGHVDHCNYDSAGSDVIPIRCSHRLIEVDTDRFEDVNVESIVQQIISD